MLGAEKISRKEFYGSGGFSNPNLFRKASKGGVWSYYRIHREYRGIYK